MKAVTEKLAPNRISTEEFGSIQNKISDVILSDSLTTEEKATGLVAVLSKIKTVENHRKISLPTLPSGLNSLARAVLILSSYTPAELANESYYWSFLSVPEIAYAVVVDSECAKSEDNAKVSRVDSSNRRSFERSGIGRLATSLKVMRHIWDEYKQAKIAGKDTSCHIDEMNAVALALLVIRNSTFTIDRELFDDEDILVPFVRGYVKACQDYNRPYMDNVWRELPKKWYEEAATTKLGLFDYDELYDKAYNESLELARQCEVEESNKPLPTFEYSYEAVAENSISKTTKTENDQDVAVKTMPSVSPVSGQTTTLAGLFDM